MKFRFVRGLDCPDWILQEVAMLSKLSVIKFKHWCGKCVEYLLSHKNWSIEEMRLLDPDFVFGDESIKAMVAALSFIFEKAAKSNCSARNLELEMQQLGLPAEHCKQLLKVYDFFFDQLRNKLSAAIKKGPSLTPLSASLVRFGEKKTYYSLEFSTTDGEEVSITMDEDKLSFLFKELNRALLLVSKYTQQA